MKKLLTKEQMIVNCLLSDLSNFIYGLNEHENDIYCFFSEILLSAEVDSKIIVEVLEKTNNKIAKEVALGIKINEGW